MTRKEHIEKLADELGVVVHWDAVEPYRSAINMTTGDLYLSRPLPDKDGEELYWVALHELGHYATGTADRTIRLNYMGGGPEKVEDEALAWAWALDHAAFPLGQAGESNLAWSITDYMHGHGWEPSEAFERIFRAIEGEEPDWFHDVTTEAHWRKLDGWARPMWRELREHYTAVLA